MVCGFPHTHAVYPRVLGEHPPLLDFAPDEVFPAFYLAVKAVGPYPAISPLPFCFSYENSKGRYIFCGTLCHVIANVPGGYPASCSTEPGLSSDLTAVIRPVFPYSSSSISSSLKKSRSARLPTSSSPKAKLLSSSSL